MNIYSDNGVDEVIDENQDFDDGYDPCDDYYEEEEVYDFD